MKNTTGQITRFIPNLLVLVFIANEHKLLSKAPISKIETLHKASVQVAKANRMKSRSGNKASMIKDILRQKYGVRHVRAFFA